MLRNHHEVVLGHRRPVTDWLTWLLAASLILFAAPVRAGAPGTWVAMTDLPAARAGHTATLLADGKVLIAGGQDASGQTIAGVELFDPATGSYVSAGNLPTAVWGHTATLLPDGTVLLAGGKDSAGQSVAAAQVFDPVTGRFTSLTMNTARSGHTASLLVDGRVLVAGGSDGSNALGGLEAYDAAAKAFAPAGSLVAPRQDHAAALLADGRVLFVGGSNGSGALDSAEVYDPKTGTAVQAGALNLARTLASAARLLNGTVLVVGGQDSAGRDLSSAEIFDPLANSFAPLAAQLSTARSGHVGLFLENNGKILVVGGTSGGSVAPTVEIYDPISGAFFQPAPPAVARQLFGANFFLVPYTGVLVLSGGLDGSSVPLPSSEGFVYPTIRSDKPDYQPGNTVRLMGERWQPGETVNINIHESNSDPDINFGVIADASGAFSVNAFEVNLGDLQQSFITTAGGQSSLWTAQTRFTDSTSLKNVSVGAQSPNPISPGNSATYTITVEFNGNGNCTVSLSAGGLPSGASVTSFNPSSLTASKTTTQTSTLTLVTTGTASSGSFTVSATGTGGSGNNCDSGSTATGTGTLTVGYAPSITSANSTNFAVGVAGSFQVTASGSPTPVFTESGALPSGVTFTPAGLLSGTPASGTLGTYGITITASNGVTPNATQSFALTVSKATPVWNNLTVSQTITYGTASINLSGKLEADKARPANGENFAITINGNTQNFSFGGQGNFAVTFPTATIPASTTPYTISYSYSGNPDLNSAGDTSTTLTVNKATSTTTVSFEAGPYTYRGTAFTATAVATGAGGLSQAVGVVYSGDCTNVTNVNGCTATATYAGDSNHDGSSDNKSITIAKASATTTVTVSNATYDGAPHGGTALVTGVGGFSQSLSVSYVGRNGTVYPSSTTAPTNAGDYTASATFAGDANHDGSSDSKPFTINKASSTTAVTCGAGPFSYTGSAIEPCSATATGAGALNQALTVTYANNVNAGTATASATFAGDANHDGSTDSKTFTIDKAATTTTVTCDAGPFTYSGSPITPCSATVTGAGGLSQALTVTYAGNVNAGSATASASYAESANYKASSDSKTFTISKAPSATAVTFEAGPYPYRGTAFTATAIATGVGGLSSSVPVVYGGDCTNVTVANGCTATATYAGDLNHDGSSGSASITITKAPSTTTVTVSNATYDGNPHGGTASVTGAGGLSQSLSVSYVGRNGTVYPSSTTAPTNAGDYTALASYAESANYLGSSDSKPFTISKAPSATTVTCPASVTYTGAAQTPCSATVTGVGMPTQSLMVTYADNVNAGTATASASYAGDANHTSSTDSKTFTIDKAPSTTTVTCPASVTYTGAAQTPCSATATGAGGLRQSLTVSYLNNTSVGTATASASFAGDANHTGSSDTKTFQIFYNFTGFFRPVDNVPVVNVVKAGSAVPVKFSLNGYQGMNILASGYPRVVSAAVCSGAVTDIITEADTVNAAANSFNYDPTADQYIYVWKTDKTFSGCRQLQIKLTDGSIRAINFNFAK